MYRVLIRRAKTLRLIDTTTKWKDNKTFLKSNKPHDAKYDFCCMLFGQKKCGDCIFDKIKTK